MPQWKQLQQEKLIQSTTSDAQCALGASVSGYRVMLGTQQYIIAKVRIIMT